MRMIKLFLLAIFYSLDIALNFAVLAHTVMLAPSKYLRSLSPETKEERPTKHIVIVGYQFAGFEIHKLLQSNPSLFHFRFTIIEPKTYFEFTPSILSAMVNPSKYRFISFPLSECLDVDRSTLVHGKVTSIQSHAVTVELMNHNTRSIPFDFCFICTGSKYAAPIKVNTFPKVSRDVYWDERCQILDDVHCKLRKQSVNTTTSLLHDIGENKEEINGESIAIIGAGPVGVELMAEIVERYPDKQVTVIDGNDEICRSFPLRTRQYLEQWARKHEQITLRLNTRIRDIITPTQKASDSTKITLFLSQHKSRESGGTEQETLECDVVFRCSGFEPNSEMMRSKESDAKFRGCLTGKHRFIAVDEWMRVKGTECVFAMGDVVEQSRVNEIKLAHTAEIHAQYVSAMVEGMECGEGTHGMEAYDEWLMGRTLEERDAKWDMPLVYTISLGEVDGSMGFGVIQINGFLSQILKWFIERSQCTMYRRRGLYDVPIVGEGGKGTSDGEGLVFRVYPLGFRIFTLIWWFNHHLTLWYIRHFH